MFQSTFEGNEELGSYVAVDDICQTVCCPVDMLIGPQVTAGKKGMLGGQGAMLSHFPQLVHFLVMESAVTFQLKKSHTLTPGFLQRLQIPLGD